MGTEDRGSKRADASHPQLYPHQYVKHLIPSPPSNHPEPPTLHMQKKKKEASPLPMEISSPQLSISPHAPQSQAKRSIPDKTAYHADSQVFTTVVQKREAACEECRLNTSASRAPMAHLPFKPPLGSHERGNKGGGGRMMSTPASKPAPLAACPPGCIKRALLASNGSIFSARNWQKPGGLDTCGSQTFP